VLYDSEEKRRAGFGVNASGKVDEVRNR
jgi:hypothetical protein